MIKNMKKQDGYILAYALVVIMVISLVAVAACTTAARNHKSQVAALQYTEDKYAAEGAIELFVAELQSRAVEFANREENKEITAATLNNGIGTIIGTFPAIATDDMASNCVCDAISIRYINEDYSFIVKDVGGYAEEGAFVALFEEVAESEEELGFASYIRTEEQADTIKGNAYYLINAEATFGEVVVSAKVKLSFAVDKGAETSKVHGVMFEYISYEVSTVQKESEVGS